MVQCAVWNCNSSNNGKDCQLSFFRFPQDKVLQRAWKSFCRREDNFNPATSFICLLHFKSEDIENRMQFEMGKSRELTKKEKINHV